MRTIIVAMTPLLLLAGGCGDGKGGDDTGETGDGTVQGQPVEGDWTATATVVDDGCNLETKGDTGAGDEVDLYLDLTSDTTFDLYFDSSPKKKGGEGMVLSCTLAGADFSCDPFALEDMDMSEYGYDAYLTMSLELAGSFPTWDTMDATGTVSIDCSGKDCDVLAKGMGWPLPCESTYEFAATALSDAGA